MKRIVTILMASMVSFGVITGSITSVHSVSYTFIEAEVPGATTTYPTDINNSDSIVGYYALESIRGFAYDGTTYSYLDFPGARQTRPQGINDDGVIIGHYTDNNFRTRSFVYDGNTYETVHFPGSVLTYLNDINNDSQIIGSYGIYTNFPYGYETHSFIYDGSSFTEIKVPGSIVTSAIGINDAGEILGSYRMDDDHSGSYHFLYDGSTYSTFAFPGIDESNVIDLNNNGEILGSYWERVDRNGQKIDIARGIVYDGVNLFSITDDIIDIHASGINDNRVIVGRSVPIPEPSTLLILGSGLVGLVVLGRKRFRK